MSFCEIKRNVNYNTITKETNEEYLKYTIENKIFEIITKNNFILEKVNLINKDQRN